MGKKIEPSKEVATAPVAEKKPAKTVKAPAKKSAVKKAPASVKKSAKVEKATFTNDDIALRAYFIAEKRHKAGHHGNPHHDWVEAEKQLLAESKKKPAAKAVKKA
ncbi:MAG: DUF2934 domain-containing protein [Chthoniobacteraceae bacterium]